jgi:glycosyltransferase involved in cell wall biosynthesis
MFLANSISGGGAELAARILASKLNSVEFPCSFVAINDWPDDEASFSMDVFRLGRKYKGSLINLATSLLKFNKLLRNQKPDFLVVNCELPELFSLFAPRNCQRIVVEHTSKPWSRLQLLGLIVRRFLILSNAVWVSVSITKGIWGVKTAKHMHIPNPMVHDLAKFPIDESDIKRLFFVGRLNSIKQPDFIVQASKRTGIPAILIGAGPEYERIQNLISEENLDIRLEGHSVSPWDHLRKGDLVIVPSMFEGDGLVASEAIIIGSPILLLDRPDLQRFGLKSENYFYDFTDLVHKIEKHKLSLSELIPDIKTRESQLEERSPEFVARKWRQLFLTQSKAP